MTRIQLLIIVAVLAALAITTSMVFAAPPGQTPILDISPPGNNPTWMTEGDGPRSYTVKPNSQSTGNVTVVANNQHLADVTVSPTSLTFTTSNRNTTQSIAITAFDDTQAEGGEWIDISHRVNGGGFNNTPAEDFTFRLRDNDSYAHAEGDSSVRARLR